MKKRMGVMSGFTLIELLVVISIIALLLSVLLPALNAAKLKAKVVVCSSGLKQVSTALSAYLVDNKDHYPPFIKYDITNGCTPNDSHSYSENGVWVRVFQNYIEKSKATAGSPISKVFYCPLGPAPGKTMWKLYSTGATNVWPKDAAFYVTMGYNMYAFDNTYSVYSTGRWISHNVTRTSTSLRASEFLLLVDNANMHNASCSSGASPSSSVHSANCPKGCMFVSRNHPKNMANVVFGDTHVAPMSRDRLDHKYFNDPPYYRQLTGKEKDEYPWRYKW